MVFPPSAMYYEGRISETGNAQLGKTIIPANDDYLALSPARINLAHLHS